MIYLGELFEDLNPRECIRRENSFEARSTTLPGVLILIIKSFHLFCLFFALFRGLFSLSCSCTDTVLEASEAAESSSFSSHTTTHALESPQRARPPQAGRPRQPRWPISRAPTRFFSMRLRSIHIRSKNQKKLPVRSRRIGVVVERAAARSLAAWP